MKTIIQTLFIILIGCSHSMAQNPKCAKSIGELKELKSKYLKTEDYSLVEKVQDEINKREQSNAEIKTMEAKITDLVKEGNYSEADILQKNIESINKKYTTQFGYCENLQKALNEKDYKTADYYQKLLNGETTIKQNIETPKQSIAVNKTSQNIQRSSTSKSSNQFQNYFYMGWNSNFSAPASMAFATLNTNSKKIGLYLNLRMTLAFDDGYECDEYGIKNGNSGNSYYFTGNSKLNKYHFVVGTTSYFFKNCWVYAGLGYSEINFLHEYENSYGSSTWAKHSDYKVSGFAWDGGLMYRMGGLMMTLGYSSIDFSHFEVTYGIGFSI